MAPQNGDLSPQKFFLTKSRKDRIASEVTLTSIFGISIVPSQMKYQKYNIQNGLLFYCFSTYVLETQT